MARSEQPRLFLSWTLPGAAVVLLATALICVMGALHQIAATCH